MTKVTNNHDGLLNIAGTDVRPGKTVEIDDKKFENWSQGGPAKQWLKNNIVSADAKVDLTSVKSDENLTDRQRLEAKAVSLGIDFNADTTDEELSNAIAEVQEENSKSERENLLKEARDLGLNPNANTGIEKLKKAIAEKKAAGV